MSSAGPLLPTAGSDDAAVGTLTWVNPTRITASDNSRSTCVAAGQTHYLKGLDFDFAIPAGATIDGILVEIERCSALADDCTDAVVKLVKGGSVVGDNKAAAGFWPAAADAVAAYGGAADKWGTTWAVADINAADFGVVLSVTNADAGARAQVDAYTITVTYTEAGGARQCRALLGVGW